MHYILKKYRNYRILYLLAYLAFRVTMKWYCTAVSRSCLSFNRRFWEHASSRKVRYFLEVVVHRLGIFWRFSVFFKRTSNLKVNRPNMTGATAQEIETQVKDSYKNISTQYTQINIRATCEQFSVWCQIHQNSMMSVILRVTSRLRNSPYYQPANFFVFSIIIIIITRLRSSVTQVDILKKGIRLAITIRQTPFRTIQIAKQFGIP